MSMSHAIERRHDVTGLILAGGRGLRFGGMDKGLVEFRGMTLAEHQLRLLAPQVSRVLVSANRNAEHYLAFGVEVVGDTVTGWPGPLAGMLAGARAAGTGWIACMPCDTLGAPPDSVARLLAAATEIDSPAAYAVGDEGAQYPLCVLHTRLAGALQAALEGGRRAVRDFLQAQRAAAADFHDCRLRNINHPGMLA